MHHALGGGAYDGPTDRANGCADRSARQADHATRDRARGGRTASRGVRLVVIDGLFVVIQDSPFVELAVAL